MGSKKSYKGTEYKPVADEISVHCEIAKASIQGLEKRIETDFPFAVEETAITHQNLQQAWYHYIDSLSDSIENDRIRRGKRTRKGELIEADENHPKFKIVPAQTHPLNSSLAGFFDYLSTFGEVSVSSYYEICVNQRRKSERFGVHIKRNNDKTPVFFGFIDDYRDKKGLEYHGYIPVKTSLEEFFGTEIYDLNSNPDLQNCAYVRLAAEKSEIGIWRRVDSFESRGIPFP